MSHPRSRKSAADRKVEIVETAIRLSAEIGPNRVTTQHLADAVGVTQPAIFRHFATKSEIWLEVGDHIIGQMQALNRHMTHVQPDDLHGHLHEVVGRHFVHIAAQPAIPAILFSRELLTDYEPLRVKVDALLDERRTSLATLIRKAQDTGLHKAELIADDAAVQVLAIIQGLSMRWLVANQGFDLAAEGRRVVGGLLDSFRV